MRVKQTTWRGTHEMNIEEALTPDYPNSETPVELAHQVLGRLLAALVRKGVLDLKTAGEIADEYELEEVR